MNCRFRTEDTAVGKERQHRPWTDTLIRTRFLSVRTFFHALPTVIFLVAFFQRLGCAVQRIINKSNVRCLYSYPNGMRHHSGQSVVDSRGVTE